MTGTINQIFRQRFLQEFVEGTADISSVYLVFSNNTARTLSNIDDTSEVPITAIHEDGTAITARYAVRLDTNDRLQYARVKQEGDSGTEVRVDGTDYIVVNDISSLLNQLWTNAYFNAPIEGGINEDFNIVSVVLNLDSTADTLDVGDFSDAMFSNAEIVMMSRPGTKNIAVDITDAQFPGIIKF